MESIGTMAGGIAHDLNNVLAPILMAIELLREGETDANRLELLATMEASAQRGADMVRQVLFFARGVEGQPVLVDPATVVRDVQRILRDALPKNIALELSMPKDLWKVKADATQLHQVLMNLCVNARDAMPEGGRLTLALDNAVVDEIYAGMNPQSKPGAYVMLKVADTGFGIPTELQERVFEPFFTTKEVGSGTGLGLSTVHTIIRGHGGFVNLYSEPGRGSEFRIYLPADASGSDIEGAIIESSPLPRGTGEWILVVDDEESIRDVTKRTLERFGYRVLVAVNGAEAISIFARKRGEIAVVLTDMAMPVMDGPATIHALRAIDPAVRIIGSSGLTAEGLLVDSAGAGLQRFVPKPYTADVLLRAVREVILEKS
jgi:CheY-like chemotaxis protein